jgi:hypothetical protein
VISGILHVLKVGCRWCDWTTRSYSNEVSRKRRLCTAHTHSGR